MGLGKVFKKTWMIAGLVLILALFLLGCGEEISVPPSEELSLNNMSINETTSVEKPSSSPAEMGQSEEESPPTFEQLCEKYPCPTGQRCEEYPCPSFECEGCESKSGCEDRCRVRCLNMGTEFLWYSASDDEDRSVVDLENGKDAIVTPMNGIVCTCKCRVCWDGNLLD